MTGARIDATNTEVLVVDVESNSEEDITAGSKVSKINEASNEMEIDIEEEKNTEAYQETLNIDIENIDRIENIHKHHKTPWRTIYEVIQQEFFE